MAGQLAGHFLYTFNVFLVFVNDSYLYSYYKYFKSTHKTYQV